MADGIIATSQLASTSSSSKSSDFSPIFIADKFQRVLQEMQEADILFLIQKSDIQKKELKSEDLLSLTKKIQEVKATQNKQVAGLEVSGYASPDGGMDINTNLAEKRQQVTVDYLNKELKKLKTSVTMNTKFTAEDWVGFQNLMENSNIQDKQVILRVLSMYTDPEQREREIKNLSVAFKSIAEEILPQLRRSKMKLTVDVTGKSDAELTKLAKEDASKLSVEELLFAATLTTDLTEKASIFQKVTEIYPSDVRGFNNLGGVNYQQGNIDAASRYFGKALEINPQSADINFNAGIASLAKGNLDKSEVFFGKAAGTSGNLSQGLGTIYLIKGDYSKSKSYFGSIATNNAGLLQILNSDYSGARKTLAAVAQPDAMTAYLNAIVGARTNDRDVVYSSLKSAVKQDKSFGLKAQKDLEFSKFFAEPDFISIVK